METVKEIKDKTEEKEITENESGEGDRQSERSGFTTRTWQSSWGGSTSKGSGDRLSFREVGKIKKMVADKEREERKNNITIKGMTSKERERIEKEDIEKWLKQKIDVECKVMSCRQSGTVTIAKIESEEKKKEIMRNKYKLRGEKFYIENDLSWEERRTQEQITRWAKEQKAKGEEVKVGLGRIRIKGRWKSWAEIKQEEEKEQIQSKELGESREGREKEGEQNFAI